MGKKKAPKAPDMTTPAMQDTYANRPNQTSAWGSTTWDTKSVIDPSTGKPMTQWNQNTTLNPQDQAMLDQQRGIQGGLWGQAQKSTQNPMDYGQFGKVDMGGPQMGLRRAGNIQGSFGGFGNVQSGLGNAGNIQSDLGLQNQLGSSGNIQDSLGLQSGLGNAGNIQRDLGLQNQLGSSGDIQGQLGNAGDIRDQYDFDGLQNVAGSQEQRQRAEDAMYQRMQSRLDPQWQQREQQFEAGLAGRGAGQSSAAERARLNQGQQRTDAYGSAALDSIIHGGNEMQRSFGMDMNLRQQQQNEAMAQGQFGNQAQQQRFGQNLAGAQFGNQARMDQGQFSNQARLAQGQFGNQAQQQQFGQNLAGAEFGNQARMQEGMFGNAAQQQRFGQNLAGAEFGNQARMQQGQFGNAAQQQQFGQNLAGGQFANQAQQQQWNQGLGMAQFGNEAQQQRFGQNLAGGQFANQAQQQRFGQQTMNREQQIQDALRQRQQPMQDLRMMQGLGPQNPQFAGYGAGGGQADAVGQNYANQVNQTNAANQQNAGMWGTVGSLAGMALFSDERLKEIGPRVGTHPRGVGLYLFRYLWEPVWRLGVIAQEVQQVAPELVGESQGFLTVNYEGL